MTTIGVRVLAIARDGEGKVGNGVIVVGCGLPGISPPVVGVSVPRVELEDVVVVDNGVVVIAFEPRAMPRE